jgi:hypothetical protein
MKIIYSKAGQGRTNELLRRFLKEGKSASFLTDRLNLNDIIRKIEKLKKDGEDICDLEGKEVKTNMNVNCNSDYFNIIHSLNSQKMFLDLSIPKSFKNQFKSFCMEMEREYGLDIWLAEQLPVDSEIEGLKIVEYLDGE